MSPLLPTVTDFDPYRGDLDAKCAWKNFGGLSLDQATEKFEESPETYQEDFMFMGAKAFAFYYPVIDRFLRKTVEIAPELRGDRQSWILSQCIQKQFEGQSSHHVLHLKDSILELCDFMLLNIMCFSADWNNPTELGKQWEELKNYVSQHK